MPLCVPALPPVAPPETGIPCSDLAKMSQCPANEKIRRPMPPAIPSPVAPPGLNLDPRGLTIHSNQSGAPPKVRGQARPTMLHPPALSGVAPLPARGRPALNPANRRSEMSTPPIRHDLEQGDPSLPATGRPVVRSTEGVISSGHYLTSMAGMRMLLAGGNAFDALVAAGFAAAVVEPIASYSLAAEGVFMLYDSASGDLLSLSGQGTAPGRATADFYLSRGHRRIPTGPGMDAPLAFTLPGIVHAFISLLERCGTMELAEVLAPAVSYAAEGIPHYEYMLERLHSRSGQQQFDNFPPGGWDVFYHDRQVPPAGSLLVQPGLAHTLQAMRDAAASANGDRSQRMQAARDAFYRGPIAGLLVECSEKVGGIISGEDLASYSSSFETPVSGAFNGYGISCQDSWSQAPMLVQVLNILENFDLKAMGHNSPAYIHTVAEALKLGFGDREAFYADPAFATVPLDGLLSKEYAAERSQLIDPEGAYPAQPPAGDPWPFSRHNGSTPSPVMSEPMAARCRPFRRRRHHPRFRPGQTREPRLRHHQRRPPFPSLSSSRNSAAP